MSETTGLVTESMEALAEALSGEHEIFNGANGQVTCSCDPLPWLTFEQYGSHLAAALIASGVVRPADEVRAEAFKQGWQWGHKDACPLDAEACALRHRVRAALAEEGGDRG